jgi:hypothetical protein
MAHLERRLRCKFDQALAYDARRPIRTNYDISRDALARGQQDRGRGRIDRDDARTRADLDTRRARVRAQNLIQIRVLPGLALVLNTSAASMETAHLAHDEIGAEHLHCCAYELLHTNHLRSIPYSQTRVSRAERVRGEGRARRRGRPTQSRRSRASARPQACPSARAGVSYSVASGSARGPAAGTHQNPVRPARRSVRRTLRGPSCASSTTQLCPARRSANALASPATEPPTMTKSSDAHSGAAGAAGAMTMLCCRREAGWIELSGEALREQRSDAVRWWEKHVAGPSGRRHGCALEALSLTSERRRRCGKPRWGRARLALCADAALRTVRARSMNSPDADAIHCRARAWPLRAPCSTIRNVSIDSYLK